MLELKQGADTWTIRKLPLDDYDDYVAIEHVDAEINMAFHMTVPFRLLRMFFSIETEDDDSEQGVT